MTTTGLTQTANTTTNTFAGITESKATTAGEQPNMELSAVFAKIPIPRMNNNDIESWFLSLDFWFPASGIVADKQRYNTVLAAVDSTILPQLRGIINATPESGKYEYIKEQLIAHFSESEQRRLNRVLSEMPLGDLKPSQLFHEMRRVASNSISDAALKGLWAQRLPDHARAAVAASAGTVEEFTKIADAIVDVMQMRTINAVKRDTETTRSSSDQTCLELKAEIAQLTKKIESLWSQRRRSRSRNSARFTSHTRSQTPVDPNAECWYHQQFGRRSRKCRSPCRHKKTATSKDDSSG